MRIGAFWARPMPTDGSRRFLRARLTGRPPSVADAYVQRLTANGDVRSERSVVPRGRAWIGTLEVPAVCVD